MNIFEYVQTLPTFKTAIAGGYQHTATYTYFDKDGKTPLFWRVRLDHPNGDKMIRPVHQAIGDIYELGEPDFIKNVPLKPLYNQHLPLLNPKATIWVVEGEKCTDRMNAFFLAQSLGDQHIAVTSGSATSGEKTDLTLLVNRTVIIWPDNDDEGKKYAQVIRNRLNDVATNIKVIDVDRLGLAQKEDCVDWLERYSYASIQELLELPGLSVQTDFNQLDVYMINMEDVEMKPINWLWPKRIACGKLTLLAGDPGLGKSQLTAALAAHVTTGLAWPDMPDTIPQIGNVILLSAEDDASDTIKPRLAAVDADMKRVKLFGSIIDNNQNRAFDLSKDVERLRSAIAQLGNVRLVVIDPISAYLGSRTDSNSNTEIRQLMAPLHLMAADTGVAIVVVTHFNKSTTQDLVSRVIGSVGMIAGVRGGYAVLRDSDNTNIRKFVPIKNNIGTDHNGLTFTIEPVKINDVIETSRIVWGEVIEHNPVSNDNSGYQDVDQFLRGLIENSPRPAKEIFQEGKEMGYSPDVLRRTKKRLGIRDKKLGMKGGFIWGWPAQLCKLKETPEYRDDREDDED